jgi:ribose transport system permease protein
MNLSGSATKRLAQVLQLMPLIFFLVVVLVFGKMSDRFLSIGDFTNILLQSAHLAVLAIGMSFVLLIGGVDLSVGSNMYLAGVLVGLYLTAFPAWISLVAAIGIGAAIGALNAIFVVYVRVAPFIVTLSVMFVARGVGLFLSNTQMVFIAPSVIIFTHRRLLGLPIPILLTLAAMALAFFLLRMAPFGRAVYAVGADREGARRAGLKIERVTFALYCLCGAFAGLGGFILLSQIATASSTFGENKEFLAIAAAVLGGTSMFGGRGGVSGPVMGAVLIQTVESGLVMANSNPYIYPIITAAVIFLAVFLDSIRTRALSRLGRRHIRVEETTSKALPAE